MDDPARPDARWRYLGAAALIVAAVLTLPSAGSPLLPGGEFQYQAAMIVAFREHLQWGSQVIWTYGPYGYMDEPFFMDFTTWALAFVANLIGHVAWFGVLALFLVRIRARPWLWILVSLAIVLLFDRYAGQFWERFPVLDHEAALSAILLLFLAAEAPTPRMASLLAGAAGLIIGYLLLDKGTFLMVGLGLAVAYVVLNLARSRAVSIAALAAGAVAGYLALWTFDGQSIPSIPAYFGTFYEIISGYTGAMSWFRESGAAHPALQLGLGSAMLAATALTLVVTLWQRDWSMFRLVLLTSPLLMFVFKNSFVRFDEGHALAFWALAGVLQSLALVRALAATGRRVTAPVAIAGVSVLASVVLVGGLGSWIGGLPANEPSFGFPDNLVGDRHALALFLVPGRRQQEEAQVTAALRGAYGLPPDVVDELSQGSTDPLPVDLQAPFAYGLQWDPQPVLQAYNAYGPGLDHLDAQHLAGSNAPRFVLFASGTVDGRYPLFDAPETYRVLFQRYSVLQRASNLLILENQPDEALPPQVSVGSATGQLGQWIPVPPHGDQRLYGRVQVGYSLLGKALYVLNSPPELHIRLMYGGGQVSPVFRFVPAVAPDGLDLSTYAPDDPSIERLAGGHFDQPIEAIQIVADAPSSAYLQAVTVSYFTQPVG